MRKEAHSQRLRVGRFFLEGTPKGSVILGDPKRLFQTVWLLYVAKAIRFTTGHRTARSSGCGSDKQNQSGLLQAFQQCLPLAKCFPQSSPSIWVMCILCVTFLYIFPHFFTGLTFLAVLLVTTEPSGGKGANSRHNGRSEIDVLDVEVKQSIVQWLSKDFEVRKLPM